VQLAPLSLYNFVLFDQLRDLPPPDEYDPRNPPESVVLISDGNRRHRSVVTNGYRVLASGAFRWAQPLYQALTKDLKQTFAQAEHLNVMPPLPRIPRRSSRRCGPYSVIC